MDREFYPDPKRYVKVGLGRGIPPIPSGTDAAEDRGPVNLSFVRGVTNGKSKRYD